MHQNRPSHSLHSYTLPMLHTKKRTAMEVAMHVYQVTWSRRLLSSKRPMVWSGVVWVGLVVVREGGVACVCGHIYVWCGCAEVLVLICTLPGEGRVKARAKQRTMVAALLPVHPADARQMPSHGTTLSQCDCLSRPGCPASYASPLCPCPS